MDHVVVQNTDTLEGIAAAHDCTVGMLVKLNKLPSRMVFPGQKLIVPRQQQDGTSNVSKSEMQRSKTANNNNDDIHKGPGCAVRTTPEIQPTSSTTTFNFVPTDNSSSAQQKLKIVTKNQSGPSSRRSNTELGRMASELDPDDQECLQKFLKIRVKQVTESDGTIVGTLLITPNCLMFDPDIDHPLVQENGSDLYGMVANMEDIVSVTVYKNISSLIGEKSNKEEDIFDPRNVAGSPKKLTAKLEKKKKGESTDGKLRKDQENGTERRSSDAKFIGKPTRQGSSGDGDVTGEDRFASLDDGHPLVYGTSAGGLLLGSTLDERNAALLAGGSTGESSLSNSEQQLPCIDEETEDAKQRQKDAAPMDGLAIEIPEKRRTVSDMHRHMKPSAFDGSVDSGSSSPSIQHEQVRFLKGGQQSVSLDRQSSAESDKRQRAHSDLEQSNSLAMGELQLKSGAKDHRRSPSPSAFSRYSPGMARKSFGKLGRTLSAKATSIKGTVQSGAQSVASGTQKVAHGVVTHTLSAADHIQTGIQTGGAKMMAMVPNSLNSSAEFLQEGLNLVKEGMDPTARDKSPQDMKREKSLATLETLCQRTHQKREQAAVQKAQDTGFVLGSEEGPVLNEDENVDQNRPIGTPPDPPFYMIVRVDRRKKRKRTRQVILQDTLDTSIAQQKQSTPLESSGGSHSASSVSAADLQQEENCPFGNKRKREFWFAIPRNRVDSIYHFLLQWSPQKYGQEQASTAEETNVLIGNTQAQGVLDEKRMVTATEGGTKDKQHLSGFVVLEGDVDDNLAGLREIWR